MKILTCCISGSRPQSMPWGFDEDDIRCVEFKKKLESEIIKLIDKGCSKFICGMAQGVDQFAFEILLDYKRKYPESKIYLEAAIPCESQADRWSEPQREKYFNIMTMVDKETLISKRYTNSCMRMRNQYMVDNSDLLLAAISKNSKGTAYTINYAEKKGKEIIKIII